MKYLILLLLFSKTFIAFSQNYGTLKGRVTDENINNEPVAFANVAVYKQPADKNANLALLDMFYGTSTDENGDYYIPNLPTGLYLVEVTYIDFPAPLKFNKLKIETDKTTVLDAKYPKMEEEDGRDYFLPLQIDVPPMIDVSNTSNTTTIKADDIRRMGIR